MARVRAPSFTGRGWIGSQPLEWDELTTRVVVIHFFTPGCIGCERALVDLAAVEARWGSGQVVVVGVLTPKFDREATTEAAREGVRRLGITHPVLFDPDHLTAQAYGVRAWPTIVVVGADGYLVGSVTGDGRGAELLDAVAAAVAGQAHAMPLALAAPTPPPRSALAFPGKAVASADGVFVAVADTGHDRVVVLTGVLEDEPRLHQVVTGLARPQGVRFRPVGGGWQLLVCDTGHDRLLGLDVRPGRVDAAAATTLALGVASPFDVIVDPADDRALVIAEAGRHRLLRLRRGGKLEVLSGTGQEGLEDGQGRKALHAQPSALAALPKGLLVADAEASALRAVDVHGRVATLVGTGTFAWGAADGPAGQAALQHPRGVAVAPDRSSAYVADTYNDALRLWSGVDGELHTIALPADPEARGLAEPGGVDVLPDGRVLVADTGHHRLLLVDLGADRTTVVHVPDAELGPPVRVAVDGTTSVDWSLDLGGLEADGPVEVEVEVEPAGLATARTSGGGDETSGVVQVLGGRSGVGRLRVRARATTCDDTVCMVVSATTEHTLLVEAGR